MAGTSTERKEAEPAKPREDTASGERTPVPEAPVKAEADTVRVASAEGQPEHIDDEVWEYLQGECTEARLAQIDAHLDSCESCRELLHHLVQGMAATGQRAPAGGELESYFTSFSPGTVVNSRFVIRNFVGKGGMGEVYEALDRLTNTRIALKTILCSVEDRPRAARRLIGEVLNAQRVGHPHVCRINELHEHTDGLHGSPIPFFTMEFVDGVRLSQQIRKAPLTVSHTRAVARQLLSGLAAAHSRGVLHLDLKSDNVMLRSVTRGAVTRSAVTRSAVTRSAVTLDAGPDAAEPDAVIMDFGLSRLLEKGAKQHTSERHQIVGTLPYMSLEQLECRDSLGPTADIYSFGVVLYEMLTGAFPFRSDSLRSLIAGQIGSRPAVPSTRTAGLSPVLDHFVLRCLSREPAGRYADASAALAAFDATGAWTVTTRDGRWRSRRVVALLAAAALLTVLVIAVQRRPALERADSYLRAPTAAPAPPPRVESPPVVVSSPAQVPPVRNPPASPTSVPELAEKAANATAPVASPAALVPRRATKLRPAPPVASAARRAATQEPSSSPPPAALSEPPSPAATAPEQSWPAGVPQRLLARPKPPPALAP